ncbi:MAG TPA: DUF4010 domain-containing protein [Xanthobacteraceae bacterium]
MDFELIQRLVAATLIGLLVGVERGWRQRAERAGSRTAGIRTFTLIGLLGGIFGAIAKALGDPIGAAIVLAVGFTVFSAIFAAFRLRENEQDKRFGATTMVAAIALFAIGAYAVLQDAVIAAALGVAVTIILAARDTMHGWVAKVTWPELRSGIVLAAMTFLALPILPNESFGPFGGVNPRQIWLLAVVLAGISFFAYAAAKGFGVRYGLLAAAAVSGLVSSTAVAVTAARRAAAGEAAPVLFAASAMLASAVSFVRTLILIAALNSEIAIRVAAPLLAATAAALAFTYLMTWRNLRAPSKTGFVLRNPFSLRETLGLALLLAAVLFVTRAAAAVFGPATALAATILAGIADVDSATYTLSQLAGGPLTPGLAALGLLLAVTANNLFKIVIGVALGGRTFAIQLALGLGISTAVGAVVALGTVAWLFAPG